MTYLDGNPKKRIFSNGCHISSLQPHFCTQDKHFISKGLRIIEQKDNAYLWHPFGNTFFLVDTVMTRYYVKKGNWHPFCFLMVMKGKQKTKHFTINLGGTK